MKKYLSIRTLFNIGIMLVFMFSALLPATTSLAASAQARLTVVNRSSTTLKLWLSGPAIYRISVPSGQTKTYAVNRGEYKYTASACGIYATGKLDMSINKTLVMPICGGRVPVNSPHTEDLGKVLKVVKIEVQNKSTGVATAVFKGPSVYMLTLQKGADNDYTFAKGDYKVTVYTCGTTYKRNFTAEKGKKFVIICP
jgi:hypothetical protein